MSDKKESLTENKSLIMEIHDEGYSIPEMVENIKINIDIYEQKTNKKAQKNRKYNIMIHQKYIEHADIIENIDKTYAEIRYLMRAI